MADSLKERPFDNFKVAITDPAYFFGRSNLLELLRSIAFQDSYSPWWASSRENKYLTSD